MFGKLKDKLKDWAKKIKDSAVETIEEIIETPKEEPKEKAKETPKKKQEKKKEKPEKSKPEKKLIELIGKKKDSKEKKPKEEKIEKVPEEEKEEIEEPQKETKEEILEIPKPVEKEEIIEEKAKEPPKPGTESFFRKIVSKISKVKISEKEFEIYSEELEMLLLENNVAYEAAEKIIKELKEKIIGKEFLKKEVEEEIKDLLKEIIEEILIEPFDIIEKIKEKKENPQRKKDPYVILFCGINGTGKTTTVAKIADLLKKNKISCVIAAADTFRAASIEQIKKHGEKLDIKIISHEYGSDPASVGFDAVKYAKKNLIDCVLIDTAGRMHTAKNLLKEIEKISKVCSPDTKIFVGESLTGNDAIEQIRSFNWAIGIDGIILTKADIDEKGGTALSVGYVTKKPILYLGTGQEYNKIEIFDKQKFIEKLGL